jgi:hypothetical protein
MIKNKLILVICLAFILIAQNSYAQVFGNEWIDFNQIYYKLKIGKNGLYRISQTELGNAGFPVESIDPRRLQVFKNGQEQAIKIEGQSDGVFHNTDYIEFYGETNDGKTDADLYVSAEAQPHSFQNIFSDSAVYFITYKLSATNGVRMSSFSENNVSGIVPDEYYLEDSVRLFTSDYHEGRSYGASNQVILPQYDFGEGFTGPAASNGKTIDYTFQNITNTHLNDVKAKIEVMLVGRNNNSHNVQISVGPDQNNLRSIFTATFNQDDNFLVSSEIEWTDISATGSLTISASVNGVNGAADRVSMSYVRIIYPRQFDFSTKSAFEIVLQTQTNGKSYIESSNPPISANVFDITDTNNPINIGINESTAAFNAVIPNTNVERTLWVQSTPFEVSNIEVVTFQKIDATLYNYLIITHESLQTVTTDGRPNPINSYKAYRESSIGGSHSVLIQNIGDLFNQFNFGLPSPIAIRRYCNYMLSNGSPEYLLLIGRPTNIQSNYFRTLANTAAIKNLVPTFGFPGSDVAYTAGLDGTTIYPAIPTGRLNATNSNHIQNYLDKVIETEAKPVDNLRQKHLLQLSGGVTQNELNNFKAFINGFKNIAVAPLLGGTVSQVSKNSNDAVELINISEEINDGVIMVTFFGHSSAGITDIEVGKVSDPSLNYSNNGKYPVFLVNGCNAGDFFGDNESFGVDWILTPNLGALGFLAHSDLAFSNNLRNYSNLFYTVAFSDVKFIGKTLGVILKETATRYATTYSTGSSSLSQLQLLNLQGDPAIKLFGADKPDFEIDENNFIANTFDGKALLVDTDSFHVEINVRNYGTAPNIPIKVIIRRTLNNGTVIDSESITLKAILNSETLRITIDNQIENNEGLNSFEIILDPLNEFDELNEANNSLKFDLFIANGSTQNLFPTNFGVVNSSNTVLSFQSSNLLSEIRDYDIQIDTLSSFNSSYLIQQSINANVVGQLSLDLNAKGTIPASTIFYWRTKFSKPTSNEDPNWVTSSFTYNSSGTASWAQSSPVQFKDFELTGLSLDTINGGWEFLSNSTSISITTYGADHPSLGKDDTKVLIENLDLFNTISLSPYAICRDNTINFIAFDNQTTLPINPIIFTQFDELNPLVCGKIPQRIYSYTNADLSNVNGPETFIDKLFQGDQVLIYSLGQINYSAWSDAFKSKLETLGINRITLDNLQDGEPVIFFGKKGNTPNSATEVISPNLPKNQQALSLDINVAGSFGSGTIETQKIGPATQWNSIENIIDFSSIPSEDTKGIVVFGIDDDNNETSLIKIADSGTSDLTTINATTYPYLKLRLILEDNLSFTAPQLKSWKINYEQAPDGILLNRNDLSIKTKKQEGEPFEADFTYWNLSNSNFIDSIKVAFSVLNNSSNTLTELFKNINPLNSGDSVNFKVPINTINKVGTNNLSIAINQELQTEIYSNNSSLRLTNFFEVSADKTNPILEVSFDGTYILDGDIVSPNPHILARLKDENQFILKNDTLGVNVFLKQPCDGCEFSRVAFSGSEIQWTPATSENQVFSLEYLPKNLGNGVHSLKVQAEDASGNNSGLQPYEINFEVINESTVTNFYPYPNPFSTSTRFVFTLTGSEIPDQIKIQIMTVTGRVVKEIFTEELGTIRIGNNITDYAWDGRDQYGNQLANGVYLYKVTIRNNGQQLQKRAATRRSSTDEGLSDIDRRAFKNGFGKIYLLR